MVRGRARWGRAEQDWEGTGLGGAGSGVVASDGKEEDETAGRRLYIGIADGMSIARGWPCRYSK